MNSFIIIIIIKMKAIGMEFRQNRIFLAEGQMFFDDKYKN